MGLKDTLEKFDTKDITLVINLARGLFEAGQEILNLLDKDSKLSDIDLLEIIEFHDRAKMDARTELIEAIKAKRGL